MNDLNIIALSDLHLGKKKIYKQILASSKQWLVDYKKELIQADICVLNGDIFDRLLATYSQEYVDAYDWLMDICNICANNNTYLIILRGTVSHDYGQLELLNTIAKKLNNNLKFKYITKIEIVKIKNTSILFLPDNISRDYTTTLKLIDKELLNNNLTKTNLAFTHVTYDHSLPIPKEKQGKDIFPREELEARVEDIIFNGHIHEYSYKGKVVTIGSLCKLTHLCPRCKQGGISYNTSTKIVKRLYNKHDINFVTLTYTNTDANNITSILHNALPTIPKSSYVRIRVDTEQVNYVRNLVTKFPDKEFKIEGIGKEKVKEKVIDTTVNIIEINKDNIIDIVKEEISNTNGVYTESTIKLLEEVL